MSRDFTKNGANYLTFPLNAVNNILTPTDNRTVVSVHAWVYPRSTDTAANNNRVFSIICAADASALVLAIDNLAGTRNVKVGARSQSTDGFQTGTGSSDIPLNKWSSIGGVVNITGATITPYYNGAADATPAAATFGASAITLGANTISYDAIGCAAVDIPTTPLTANQFDGRIAEVAMWSVDIGAAGYKLLAQGVPALRVSPANLLFYVPLTSGSGLTDQIKGYVFDRTSVVTATATVTGSIPTSTDHPIGSLPNNYQTVAVGNGMSASEKIR